MHLGIVADTISSSITNNSGISDISIHHQNALTMLDCQTNDDVVEIFIDLLQKLQSVIMWIIQIVMRSCNANASVGCVVQVGIMHHVALKPNSNVCCHVFQFLHCDKHLKKEAMDLIKRTCILNLVLLKNLY